MELGGYPHYMLKEIFEQPETSAKRHARPARASTKATAHFGGLNLTPQQLRSVNRIVLTACGTSWHAALVGEYLIEELARIPVEVEYASELRYRNPPMDHNTLLFAITQSGETADTLAALREMKRKGHPTLAICNVVGSTHRPGGRRRHLPARRAGDRRGLDQGLHVAVRRAGDAGPVLRPAAAPELCRAASRSSSSCRQLPDKVRQALDCQRRGRGRSPRSTTTATNFLYLGRQYNFPVALEGALKLKEISYIHAEGYPAAEMKHGPIALVDEHTPSVFLHSAGRWSTTR